MTSPLPAWNFSLCSHDSSWPQGVVCVCVCASHCWEMCSLFFNTVLYFMHPVTMSHTWKACGLLWDLTDTAICLSSLVMNECTSRFSIKPVSPINAGFSLQFTLYLQWRQVDTSFIVLPHFLFFGLDSVEYTESKMTLLANSMAAAPPPQLQSVCMLWMSLMSFTNHCCIFQVALLKHFYVLYDRVLRLCISLAPCELIHSTFHKGHAF